MGVSLRGLGALALVIAMLSGLVARGLSEIAQAPEQAQAAMATLYDDPDGDPLDDDLLVAVLPSAALEPPLRLLVASRSDVPPPIFGCCGCALPPARGPPAA